MTIGQLHLDESQPYIELFARHTKNAKSAQIPLHTDLARELREYIKRYPEKKAHSKLFDIPQNFIEVFNRDLVAAGIAREVIDEKNGKKRIDKTNAQGQTVDIHSLRHTFATMLSRNGVAPRIAQELLRHSDIRLTMNTYTHLGLADTAGAVAGLPGVW